MARQCVTAAHRRPAVRRGATQDLLVTTTATARAALPRAGAGECPRRVIDRALAHVRFATFVPCTHPRGRFISQCPDGRDFARHMDCGDLVFKF